MKQSQFDQITQWNDETFPQSNTFSTLAHLQDEILEVIDALNANTFHEAEIPKEFADCFILLFAAAHKAGMSYDDITRAIDEKMQINYKRKWGAPDGNGVVHHVKETL